MQLAVIGSYLFILLMTSRSQPTDGISRRYIFYFHAVFGKLDKEKDCGPFGSATHFCEIVDPPLQSV